MNPSHSVSGRSFPSRSRGDRQRELLTCAFLAVAVGVVFWPLIQAGFVNYDDPDYVTANRHIQQGLNGASLAWAFQSLFIYWQPLTWISYMVDHQLHGLRAAGFHLTNVLLHVANTVVLFLVLKRATAAHWRSLIVALLFAFHPLHVETVAWISERKGLLSTLFGFLALAAYVRYTLRPEVGRYLVVLGCFALGLMAKPMLVTLPCLLLLLDGWPLRRLRFQAAANSDTPAELIRGSRRRPRMALGILVLEKVPLLVLSVAAGVLSVVAQRKADALASLQNLPLGDRLANACVGYGWYLVKTFWPVDLVVFYPRPEHWATGLVVVAVLGLVAVSALAVILIRRCPYVLVGWCWFLGTLVPVIGLLQVGDQAVADRYTYLPLVGLFVLLVWGAAEPAHTRSRWRTGLAGLATLLILACASLTARQIRFWQDTRTVFEHALRVNPDNPQACAVVGSLRAEEGRYDEAIRLFEHALRVNPRQSDAHAHWGLALERQNRLEEASQHYAEAIRIKPTYVEAQLALGVVLHRQGKLAEAVQEFQRVLELNPDSAAGHNNLAMALHDQGRKDDAIAHLQAAVRIDPRLAAAQQNLAVALQATGRTNEAAAHFEAARVGSPGSAETHLEQAGTLLAQGRSREAIDQFRAAMRLAPDSPAVLNDFAWILATHPDAAVRDGAEAVRFAERACQLTQSKRAMLLGTLAAAYAEGGRFDDALGTAQKAHDLALASGEKQLAETNLKLMEFYRAKKPFHQDADLNAKP